MPWNNSGEYFMLLHTLKLRSLNWDPFMCKIICVYAYTQLYGRKVHSFHLIFKVVRDPK